MLGNLQSDAKRTLREQNSSTCSMKYNDSRIALLHAKLYVDKDDLFENV